MLPDKSDNQFLPDLCQSRYVLIIVLLAELFALIVWLTAFHNWPFDWAGLGQASLFVQWVTLLSTCIVCLLRPAINKATPAITSLICLGVVLTVTTITTITSHSLFNHQTALAVSIFRNGSIATILSALVFHYLYLRNISHRSIAAKHKATIEALQARIRPHFLFNCLNTIAALIRHAPDQAEQVVEDLADLFRASIADVQTIVAIEDEVDLINRYLRIEHVRVGDRLHVKWDIDSLMDKGIRLPLLSLQPIIENAIYHGVEQIPEGGEIHIRGSHDDKSVVITVSNPVPKQARHNRQSLHYAIDNTRERLQLAFHGGAELNLDEQNDIYTVTLKIPKSEPS